MSNLMPHGIYTETGRNQTTRSHCYAIQFLGTWHATNGPVEIRELDETTEYADILAVLPTNVDGFTVGTRVRVETNSDGIVEVDERVKHNSKLYSA